METKVATFDAEALLGLIRSIYGSGPIPLHRPVFAGNEKAYLAECIDSNFVSSVGARVVEFEARIAGVTGASYAVATVNGTAALHVALRLADVEPGDEVVTQAVTFVATSNAIRYAGGQPVFVDVDLDTLGMSPVALQAWLAASTEQRDGCCRNKRTGARVAACLPMHTFGFPCRIGEIAELCSQHGIPLVEDAAESLGSYVGDQHTGTFGRLATLSFNGNKVITTGGGGMILTNDEQLARRGKHLTTTAKVPHLYEFVHDELGYNYRLPNLNAALGCAQVELLDAMLAAKAQISARYARFCSEHGLRCVCAPPGTRPNYWLNALVLGSREERDAFIRLAAERGVMTRPIWRLMPLLDMYAACEHDGLHHSRWLEDRVVNLPSSVPDGWRLGAR